MTIAHPPPGNPMAREPYETAFAVNREEVQVMTWGERYFVLEVTTSVSIPHLSASPGSVIILPIEVDNATRIAGADIVLIYDPSSLTLTNIETTDLTSGFVLTWNEGPSGTVTTALAGTSGIAGGSGGLINLTFEVSESAPWGMVSRVRFQNCMLWDENGNPIPSTTQDGAIIIGILGDLNGDGNINSGDAILVLRISVGLLIPTPYQQWAGDVNEDGEINSGDAILILRKAVGLPVPFKAVVASPDLRPSVEVGAVKRLRGDVLLVPVRLSHLRGIVGGDLVLTYDPNALRIAEVKARHLSSEAIFAANTELSGEVRVSIASSGALSEEDEVVLDVRFRALNMDQVALTPEDVVLFDGGAHPVSAEVVESRFTGEASALPDGYSLSQNVPNPFNASTQIGYALPVESEVFLGLYSLTGQLVRVLVDGREEAGYRRVLWDGRDARGEVVGNGVYFYRLRAGRFTSTKKLILLK